MKPSGETICAVIQKLWIWADRFWNDWNPQPFLVPWAN
jgi:hypothetical protein